MEDILSALESLPNLEELKVRSGRSELVKNLAGMVKQHCLLEENKEGFEAFSVEYVGTLKSALDGEATPQPRPDREQMWATFFRLRQRKLPDMWRQFLHSISCESATVEPLFMELVNEVCYC